MFYFFFERYKNINIIFAVAIMCLVFAVYANTLHYELLLSWGNYASHSNNSLLFTFNLEDYLIRKTEYNTNWPPLLWLSHAFDFTLSGNHSFGHHLINILLHGLNSVWVFVLALRLFSKTSWNEQQRWWAACISALLFAVHPQHVEAVSWVGSRKELLSAFLLFSLFYFYLKYSEGKKINFFHYCYVAALISFILVLLTNPVILLAPLVFLLVDYYPLKRFHTLNWAWLILEKIPFVLLSLGVIFFLMIIQPIDGEISNHSVLSSSQKIYNAFNLILNYPYQLVAPVFFSPLYPLDQNITFFSLLYFGFILVVCLYANLLGKPEWLVTWLSYCFLILPVTGLSPFGSDLMADRLAYSAMLPLYLATGGSIIVAWSAMTNTSQKRALITISTIIMGILIFLTHQQSKMWQNDLSLWETSVEKYPESIVAQLGLANTFLQKNQPKEALSHYRLSLENGFRLKYYFNPSPIFHGMGIALYQLDNKEEAIKSLQKALYFDQKNTKIIKNLRYMEQTIRIDNRRKS